MCGLARGCVTSIRIFCETPRISRIQNKGNRRMKIKGVPMTKHSKKLRMWIWLLALPLLQLGSGVAFAQSQPTAAVSTSVSGQAAAQVDYSTLTGTEACLHCHKDTGKHVSRTRHSGTYDTGTN